MTLVCRQPLFVLFKHFAKIDIDPCVFLRWLRVQLARQVLDRSVLFCLVLARRGLAIHRWQVHLIQRICGDIPVKVLVVLLGQAIHHLTTALRPSQLHVVVLFGLLNRLIFIETLSLLILGSFPVFKAMALDALRGVLLGVGICSDSFCRIIFSSIIHSSILHTKHGVGNL